MLILVIKGHRWARLGPPGTPNPSRGLAMTTPCIEANLEQFSSIKVTTPLVQQMPDDCLFKPLQQAVRSERAKTLQDSARHIREIAPQNVYRALDLAAEKGSSV